MQIIKYDNLCGKAKSPRLCCALGFFDGVHLGHRRLIEECIKTAKKEKLIPAVFTFASESKTIKSGTGRLYSTDDKNEIFASLGIELTVICDFELVRDMSPRDFVNTVLMRELGCKIVMTGEGFRFGKGALGDVNTLAALVKEAGRDAIIVPDHKIDGKTVSSTEIRRALSEGRIRDANAYLGAPYFIGGRVEKGRGVGHVYGFPTINTSLCDRGVLLNGVYKSELTVDGRKYIGLTNVGVCPTFEERDIHAETMILGFEGDLYGKYVKIHLIDYLRGEIKFDSPEDLKAQIEKDVKGLK